MHLPNIPVIKPSWITDSIEFGKLLDYRRYLLYSNQNKNQPSIQKAFKEVDFKSKAKSNGIVHTDQIPTCSKYLPGKSSNSDDNSFKDLFEKNSSLDEIFKSMSDCSEEHKGENWIKGFYEGTKDRESSKENMIKQFSEDNDFSKENEIKIIGNETVKKDDKSPTKTASDANFLSEFYNNSRLHLISTLGVEFKQLVTSWREKSDGVFIGKMKLLENNEAHFKYHYSPNYSKIIMHIDMDCFFVSVGLRQRPDLRGKPVAVTHARGNPIKQNNPDRQAEFDLWLKKHPESFGTKTRDLDERCSMSEIASCSYEARKSGIKNGMFLGAALKLCPDLKTIPYDFEGYKEVSKILYETVASYTLDIEAVSCDEMYVDITSILQETGMTVYEWSNHIRGEIMAKTGCPCSTGFGANRLQARLATRKAKPAGQYYLSPEDLEEYMCDVPLVDLPGVGRATIHKLKTIGLKTCGDVLRTPLSRIQRELGKKAGETLYEQAKGIDNKPLNFEHERKSVSAEVNYGIRFKNKEEALTFMQKLSEEVASRLKDVGMKTKSVTLKVMIRAADAPVETAKFLGHGVCDSLSRCTTLLNHIQNANAIFKEVKILYERLNIPPNELRGLGIQLGRLEKQVVVTNEISNFFKQTSLNGSSKSVEISCIDDFNKIINKKAVNENSNVINENVKKDDNVYQGLPENEEDIFLDDEEEDFSKCLHINVNNNFKNFGMPAEIQKPPDKNPPKTLSPLKTNSISNLTKNRGRGRPKGSKTKPKISMKMNDYFKCGKADLQKNTQKANIDMNVFYELPKDIQAELAKELNLQEKILQDLSSKNKSISVNSKGDNQKINEVKSKSSPFHTLNEEQFKDSIRTWLNAKIPQEADVKMLGLFFKELALNKRIEDLEVKIKYLFKSLEEISNCSWHKAYFSVINYAQEGMLIEYGKTLMIPRDFNCSICNS